MRGWVHSRRFSAVGLPAHRIPTARRPAAPSGIRATSRSERSPWPFLCHGWCDCSHCVPSRLSGISCNRGNPDQSARQEERILGLFAPIEAITPSHKRGAFLTVKNDSRLRKNRGATAQHGVRLGPSCQRGAGHLASQRSACSTLGNNSTDTSRFWATRTANPSEVGGRPTKASLGLN
jgi:hypothetical protein